MHDERALQSLRISLVYSRGAGIGMGIVFIGCTSDGLMTQYDRTLERKIGQTCQFVQYAVLFKNSLKLYSHRQFNRIVWYGFGDVMQESYLSILVVQSTKVVQLFITW